MTSWTQDRVWMTQETYDKLRAELASLTSDLSSDAQERTLAEARIAQLEEVLSRAETGAKPDDGLVEPGMQVTVRFAGDTAEETFVLGSRHLRAADLEADLDVYSPTSPLGAAIIGKYPGDTATYETPSGSTVQIEIVAAVPFRP